MLCLIFRATNEQSCSLFQTSSQAAIIPGRGSVLGRQNGGKITSLSVSALFVLVEVVCVRVSVCVCVRAIVCLYLPAINIWGRLLPSNVFMGVNSKGIVKCSIHVPFNFFIIIYLLIFQPQEGLFVSGFVSRFLQNPQHLLIVSLFWLGTLVLMRVLSK